MNTLHLPDACTPCRGTSAAETHFALYIYAAFVRLMRDAARHCEGIEAALQRWPFLEAYVGELAAHGLEGVPLAEAGVRWAEHIAAFEADTPGWLPLRGLAHAFALEHDDLVVIATALWPESDASLAPVFEALQGVASEPRPTASLLARWTEDGATRIRVLADLGLLDFAHRESPFPLRAVLVPEMLAEALRGRGPVSDATPLGYRQAALLPEMAELVLPDAVREKVIGAAKLLSAGTLDAIVIRGPRGNGRRSLARALARMLGRATVEFTVTAANAGAVPRWGPVAAALGAIPVARVEPAIGETLALPAQCWRHGPLVVTLPPHGGVDLQGEPRIIDIERQIPDWDQRAAMWRATLTQEGDPDAAALARSWRMGSGAIHLAARGGRVRAAVAGRGVVALDDLRAARSLLGREALDTLASFVPAEAGWSALVAAEDTRVELELLELRCRHREALGSDGPRAVGVRALFKGGSGTGKTLAARALAGALGMDLYRIDLATVISKYVGETEKNLDKVLAAAETLDILLLLDEGDALLGARTPTQSANDRFANLETNFLLQRLESFQGILVVTTNAPESIDTAFQRRMDVTVAFPAPGAEERVAIWRLHLPSEHDVPRRWLDEVGWRCVLNGGQIRNATLHARLLALDGGRKIDADDLSLAVEREYRKAGSVCPMRRMSVVQAR
jgi:hypothetical protein